MVYFWGGKEAERRVHMLAAGLLDVLGAVALFFFWVFGGGKRIIGRRFGRGARRCDDVNLVVDEQKRRTCLDFSFG